MHYYIPQYILKFWAQPQETANLSTNSIGETLSTFVIERHTREDDSTQTQARPRIETVLLQDLSYGASKGFHEDFSQSSFSQAKQALEALDAMALPIILRMDAAATTREDVPITMTSIELDVLQRFLFLFTCRAEKRAMALINRTHGYPCCVDQPHPPSIEREVRRFCAKQALPDFRSAWLQSITSLARLCSADIIESEDIVLPSLRSAFERHIDLGRIVIYSTTERAEFLLSENSLGNHDEIDSFYGPAAILPIARAYPLTPRVMVVIYEGASGPDDHRLYRLGHLPQPAPQQAVSEKGDIYIFTICALNNPRQVDNMNSLTLATKDQRFIFRSRQRLRHAMSPRATVPWGADSNYGYDLQICPDPLDHDCGGVFVYEPELQTPHRGPFAPKSLRRALALGLRILVCILLLPFYLFLALSAVFVQISNDFITLLADLAFLISRIVGIGLATFVTGSILIVLLAALIAVSTILFGCLAKGIFTRV